MHCWGMALDQSTTFDGLPDQGTISNVIKKLQQVSSMEDTHLGHFVDKATKGTKEWEETLWRALVSTFALEREWGKSAI